MQNADCHAFDLRYADYRIRNSLQEQEVLNSVRVDGVQEAVEVIEMDGKLILLNGFKRYRAACALNLAGIPWVSLGSSIKEGMMSLINQSNSKRLNILEEARLLMDLTDVQKLTYSSLSQYLGKSVGWISMRVRLFKEMGPEIESLLFEGKFPVYAYMYTLRPFIRMKGVRMKEVTAFVVQMSGKSFSMRQLEYLAQAWFKGSDEMKAQLLAGKTDWVLKRVREYAQQDNGQCSEVECHMLRILEILNEKMQEFQTLCENAKLKSNSYRCQAHYLMGIILSKQTVFIERMKMTYDQLGHTKIDLLTP